MEPEYIASPHDLLFKEAFSRLDAARSFLESAIAPALSREIDWTTLALRPGSFVDPDLRAQSSDLLYAATLRGEPLLLYFLFEHQSTEDRWMALRLLGYMLRIWEQHRKQHPTERLLPPILPLVLYQGAQAWTGSVEFSDLLRLPEAALDVLSAYTPQFEFALIDLVTIDRDRLQGNAVTRAVLALMKAAREDTLAETLEWALPLLVELSMAPDSLSVLQTLIRYFCNADSSLSKEAVLEILAKAQSPNIEEATMSIADQIRQEGRQEGWQEGCQEGEQKGRQEGWQLALRENTIEILSARFGEPGAQLRKQIEAVGDEAHLRSLLREAITVASLAEFAALTRARG